MDSMRRAARVTNLCWWLSCASASLLVQAEPGLAHERTTSLSAWDIRGRHAYVRVHLSQLDVSRYPWAATAGSNLDRLLASYLSQRLQLQAGGEPCPVVDAPRSLRAAPGHTIHEWRVECPAAGPLQIRSEILLDVAPSHLHFVRLSRDGARPSERVLSARESTWLLGEPTEDSSTPSAGTSLPGYLALGIEHILGGYDHLAFVVALLLLGGSIGEVAKVVTGFTVAHSVTLGLAVLDYVRPDPAPVEALIGLSIGLVAAENVWLGAGRHRYVPVAIVSALSCLAVVAQAGWGKIPALTLCGLTLFCWCYFELLRRASRPASLRWAIAFVFGLVHGFGFAGVLMEVGLPSDRVATALLGFNLGVEVGQLAVVALCWPVLHGLARRGPRWAPAIRDYGSAAVAAVGVFWFVTRTFGR
jgi:hypothetical protein